MRRFTLNRWWTFILALCVGTVFAISSGAPAWADQFVGPGDDPEHQPAPGPGDAGDPDQPVPAARPSIKQGAGRGNMVFGTRTAGDGRVSSNATMSRLLVVLQGLRKVYFRF